MNENEGAFLLTSHFLHSGEGLPNGEEVFQARVVAVGARRGVHIEKDGDAVSVKGHEENHAELQEPISEPSCRDEINVDKARAGGVLLSIEWVIAGGVEGGGQGG